MEQIQLQEMKIIGKYSKTCWKHQRMSGNKIVEESSCVSITEINFMGSYNVQEITSLVDNMIYCIESN